MIKNFKYLFFFFIFTLITSCSFDNKTGIWNSTEQEKIRISELEKKQKARISVEVIYKSDNIFSEVIKNNKKIVLTAPKKNLFWKMSGLNLQNFIGHTYLPKIDNNFLKKKIGKNKFSLLKIISSPLIFKDNIIFSDDKGTIFSVSQRGKVIWKINIYKKIYKKIYKNLTFSIYKDHIYVADNIGFIYKISFVNGDLIWIKNTAVPLKSNLKINKNKIFLINQDNRILCLDTESGSKIWDIRSVSSFIKTQSSLAMAISKDEDLIILNSSGDLIKIKANSGNVYWSLNTTGSLLAHDTDFFRSSELVIAENDIIFATSQSFFSYNLDNGYLNWKVDVASKNTPIVDGDNVFLVSDNGYFLNLNKQSGEIIFSTNILKALKKKKRETQIAGFILGSEKVYAVSFNGYLIVSSAVSGNVEYVKKIGDTISTNPIVSNGSLYILTENSKILGFN